MLALSPLVSGGLYAHNLMDSSATPLANVAGSEVVFDAKLFAQIEEQDTAKKIQYERHLASIKVSPEHVAFIAREMACSPEEATRELRKHHNDLQKTAINCITQFPQTSVYREKDNICRP